MKFNQRARALISGSTRALFNGSVRVLSYPRARRLVRGNRHALVVIGLCALAVGLAVPLAASRQNGYRADGSQTQTRTATVAAAPPSTAAQPSTAAAAGPASSTGAASSASSSSGASSSAGAAGSSSGASSSSSSSGGATGGSSGGSSSSTFNNTDHSSAAPARVRLTVGVSDNGSSMFAGSWFKRLHVPTARVMVPWNVAVMRNKSQLNQVRGWLRWAQADRVTPMVSFAGNGNYIPSYVVYAAAVKAFLHDFPQVKIYTPWNEPDWIYRPALANNPRLAADYFNVLIRWCHRCTIVAADVYRPSWQGLASWVSSYSRSLHARPKAWAIHPYDDVRSHTTSQLRALVSVVGNAPIWLTEISGVERRGHWGFPNQGPNGANNDERYLFGLPKRFNIQRIYHYQWQAVAAAPWDSGLLGPQGKPRPAYWTFASALKGKLP